MQREMGLLANIKKEPEMVHADLLRMCSNRLDAIRLCIQLSRMSHEAVAGELGIDKGHFCRILSGRAHFPDAKSIDLMRLCGNLAPMQYEAMVLCYSLTKDDREARKRQLERELEELNKDAA